MGECTKARFRPTRLEKRRQPTDAKLKHGRRPQLLRVGKEPARVACGRTGRSPSAGTDSARNPELTNGRGKKPYLPYATTRKRFERRGSGHECSDSAGARSRTPVRQNRFRRSVHSQRTRRKKPTLFPRQCRIMLLGRRTDRDRRITISRRLTYKQTAHDQTASGSFFLLFCLLLRRPGSSSSQRRASRHRKRAMGE